MHQISKPVVYGAEKQTVQNIEFRGRWLFQPTEEERTVGYYNVYRRGEMVGRKPIRMVVGGYDFFKLEDFVYIIYKAHDMKQGLIDFDPTSNAGYRVDLIAQTCQCPCFERISYCKHLLGAYFAFAQKGLAE